MILHDHYLDGFDFRFSHFSLQKFEHFAVISGENDEAEQDEHHEKMASEVSTWQTILADAKERSSHVQQRRIDVSPKNKVLNNFRRKLDRVLHVMRVNDLLYRKRN